MRIWESLFLRWVIGVWCDMSYQETRRRILKLAGGVTALGIGSAGVVSATDESAAITFEDQEARGGSVNVASVTLPHGGWVVLHDPGQNFDVIGHSGGLDAGKHRDVNVAIQRGKVDKDRRRTNRTLLAMAHRDTGEEGEFEFPESDPPYFNTPGDPDSGPVLDLADITF